MMIPAQDLRNSFLRNWVGGLRLAAPQYLKLPLQSVLGPSLPEHQVIDLGQAGDWKALRPTRLPIPEPCGQRPHPVPDCLRPKRNPRPLIIIEGRGALLKPFVIELPSAVQRERTQ